MMAWRRIGAKPSSKTMMTYKFIHTWRKLDIHWRPRVRNMLFCESYRNAYSRSNRFFHNSWSLIEIHAFESVIINTQLQDIDELLSEYKFITCSQSC